ncbi:YlzJ-like family protein [Staphylospora marina]|uniref:YlzJ-like family protein n=1 Tax=Staphylospora marina TaxID=2490858 RepID=UPI0019CF85AC|nr:YlzJ-like family protein [Staphylospora marina]
MIHYSVMPAEWTWLSGPSAKSTVEECVIDGVKLQIRRTDRGEAVIERLLSANPADYLNPRFQPGRKVTFAPEI